MLPAQARLHRRADFSEVVRTGRKAGSGKRVVVYFRRSNSEQSIPRVGLIVSRAVGNAVSRHRVARRLRHLMRDRLAGLPLDARVVIRALAGASLASSGQLGTDIDTALRRCVAQRHVIGSA